MSAEAEERARIQRELEQILKERALVLKERMRVEMELEQLRLARSQSPGGNASSGRRPAR